MPARSDSELLAYLSHEIRTGLNAIIGHAQLLRTSELNPTDARSIERMIDAGFYLVGILDEVEDIAADELRPDDRVAMEEINLDDLLPQLVELLGPLASAQGVAIEVGELRAGAGRATACRRRLTQILLNLMSNAIKYGGDRVFLSAQRASDTEVEISVADSGQGIDPARMRDLFEPFERLGAETGPAPGSGIGLALSQRIAESAGARLSVESDLGRGTTFKVSVRAA